MEKPTEIQQAKFNESGLAIMRLHELWKTAEHHVSAGELVKWCWSLDSIWRELYSDVLKLSDSEKILEEDKKQRRLIQFVLPNPDPNSPKKPYKMALYGLLNQRHTFLKKIQSDCGKGSAYESSVESEFD